MPVGFNPLTIPSEIPSPASVSPALAAVSAPQSEVASSGSAVSSVSLPSDSTVKSSPAVEGSQAASTALTSASVIPTSVTGSTVKGSQALSVVASPSVSLSSAPSSSKPSPVAGGGSSQPDSPVVSSTSFPPSKSMSAPAAQTPSTASKAPVTKVSIHDAAPTQETGVASPSAPPTSIADSKSSNSPAPAVSSSPSQASVTPKTAVTSPSPSSVANSAPSKVTSASPVSLPQSVSHGASTAPSSPSKTSVVQSAVVPSAQAQVSSPPASQPSAVASHTGNAPSQPAVSNPPVVSSSAAPPAQGSSPAQNGNQNIATNSPASQDGGNTPKPETTLSTPISVVFTSNHRTIVTTPPVVTSLSTSRLPDGSSTTITNIVANPTTPTVKTTSLVTSGQPNPEPQSGSIRSSSGFWNNHGAVEAVFVILGLIIVGISAFGIFWCRRWRNRRRAINWSSLLGDHHGAGSSGAQPQMSMSASARGTGAGYTRDYVVDDPSRRLTAGSVRSGEQGESSIGHGGPGSVLSSPGHYAIAQSQSTRPGPVGLSQIVTQGMHTPPYLTPFSDYYQVQPSPLELDAPAFGFAGVGAGANASRTGRVSSALSKRKEAKVPVPAPVIDSEPLEPPVRPYTHSITPSTPSMYPPSLPPVEDDASIYSQDTAKQVQVADVSGPASTAPLVPSKASKIVAPPLNPTRTVSQLPTPDDDDYDNDFKDWDRTEDVMRKQASSSGSGSGSRPGTGSGSSAESASSESATKEGYKPVTPPDSLLLSSPVLKSAAQDHDLTQMPSLMLDKVHQPQPQVAKSSMISTPPDSPTDWVHRQPAPLTRPPPIPRPLRSPLRPSSSTLTTRTLKTNMDN